MAPYSFTPRPEMQYYPPHLQVGSNPHYCHDNNSMNEYAADKNCNSIADDKEYYCGNNKDYCNENSNGHSISTGHHCNDIINHSNASDSAHGNHASKSTD